MMNGYVFEQLKVAAAGAIARCEAASSIKHRGVKGKIREIVISDLIRPVLPPTCAAGTGTIIHGLEDRKRIQSQDDIVIYDRSLVTPLLVSEKSDDGVFLYNSVLCCIEVKSLLTRRGIKKSAQAGADLANFGFCFPEGSMLVPGITGPRNAV